MWVRLVVMTMLVLAVGCSKNDGDSPATDTASTDTVSPTDSAVPTDSPTPLDVPSLDTNIPETTTPETVSVDTGGGNGALGACCDPSAAASACEAGLLCLEIPDGVPTCHQPAGNAICNVDADCGEGGFYCKGAQLCDCTVDCMTTMGVCESTGFPTVCCSDNKDCGDGGLMCVGGDNGAGVCKPIPPPVYGPCWDDAACMAGDLCVGAQSCPCNADCDMEDQIGTCEADPNAAPCGEKPKTGCSPQEDCGTGNVCMFTDSCLPSTCVCDEEAKDWICTADCSAGECVPAKQACGTANPAGCKNTGCPDGQVCGPSPDGACIPSNCFCSSQNGTVGPWAWNCTKDCAGGLCQPK